MQEERKHETKDQPKNVAPLGQVEQIVSCDDVDKSLFTCECGVQTFTYSDGIFRCLDCRNEYKQTERVKFAGEPQEYEMWLRRFNIQTKSYPENWEHCPENGYGS